MSKIFKILKKGVAIVGVSFFMLSNTACEDKTTEEYKGTTLIIENPENNTANVELFLGKDFENLIESEVRYTAALTTINYFEKAENSMLRENESIENCTARFNSDPTAREFTNANRDKYQEIYTSLLELQAGLKSGEITMVNIDGTDEVIFIKEKEVIESFDNPDIIGNITTVPTTTETIEPTETIETTEDDEITP